MRLFSWPPDNLSTNKLSKWASARFDRSSAPKEVPVMPPQSAIVRSPWREPFRRDGSGGKPSGQSVARDERPRWSRRPSVPAPNRVAPGQNPNPVRTGSAFSPAPPGDRPIAGESPGTTGSAPPAQAWPPPFRNAGNAARTRESARSPPGAGAAGRTVSAQTARY